ncbi:hypothetical protein D8674_007616 [Pyrus ussuriensis x Pyrus communis]|uniref:Neprosin PEP catalytic domain-containing protein n=1 Tax=Pyrus ussuriensis x Pyrus communis TaxID=2448454 RepID=A0A5N5HTC0_9ROSA|nr:hypothetical protein D8674_007616 [Pyrus ussuriensis x Pyrus communis]
MKVSLFVGRNVGAKLKGRRSTRKDGNSQDGQSGGSASAICSYSKIFPIIPSLVCFLLLASSVYPAAANQALKQEQESNKLKIIAAGLNNINKPALKTFQSRDGDLIDCVLSHHQPAFDHPQLKGQKPLDQPERPKGRNPPRVAAETYQLWSMSGNVCPEGTVAIRRTREEDMMRASCVERYGRKLTGQVRRETSNNGHEYAVGYVSRDQYYGAEASINVWAPEVVIQHEHSLSQMWLISGSFDDDLNTIEAGWQVSPGLYGDNQSRLFTYWTTDAYQTTGCYNLLCPGFVHTNRRFALGAAISPTSSYNGDQFDLSLLIWKDPRHGNWWLEFGDGVLLGYWPSFLFTHLQDYASMVQFGGEVVNSRLSGSHTATQMGSGYFAGEGFGRASYFRDLLVVNWDNNLIPLSNLTLLADHPNCYDIQGGNNNSWGYYFYYGGPGRNERCP